MLKRLLYILLLLSPLSLTAQCPLRTTHGTDFWATFIACVGSNQFAEQSFIVAAPRECVVTVTNGNDYYPATFAVDTVPAGGSVQISVPNTYQSYHIVSTDSIALYASNFSPASWDITAVLPTYALGKHYIVQTYSDSSISGYEQYFTFITTQYFTNLTLYERIYRLSVPNADFSVTSHSYSSSPGFNIPYWYDDHYSMSGSEIVSDKPLAVFQGHECARVPSFNGACDHLYEQALPVEYWGTDHLLVPSCNRGYRGIIGYDEDSNFVYGDIIQPGNGDIVQVTSSDDDCILWLNGVAYDTLQKYRTVQFALPADSAIRMVSSRPVTAYIYLGSVSYSGSYGDPSAVLVPPVGQGIDSTYFCAFNTDRTREHYVNIIAANEAVPSMQLDGVAIDSTFIQHDSLYSYACVSLQPGNHLLSSDGGKFVAYMYGLGEAESYAYIAGMSFNDISNLYVDGHVRQRLPDGVRACVDDTLLLKITTTLQDTSVQWFMESYPFSATPTPLAVTDSLTLPYHLTTPGTYRVSAVVEGRQCDTLSTNIYVSASSHDTISGSMCQYGTYLWNGTVITDSGFYSSIAASAMGCDSVTTLHLSVDNLQTVDYFDTICVNGSYTWLGNSYIQEGTYSDTIRAVAGGCDTLATLHLAVAALEESHYHDTMCVNGSYRWLGNSYTQEGTYSDTIRAVAGGCDTLATLHLAVAALEESHYHDTMCANGIYTWLGNSYTQEGTYSDTIRAVAGGCDTLATLHLETMPSPEVTINSSGDCESFTLAATSGATFLHWTSSPPDPMLESQAYLQSITVSPQTQTTYTLTASFFPNMECASTASVTLSPTQPVVADFAISPTYVTTDNLEYHLINHSVGANTFAWYADGEFVGEAIHPTLYADPEYDSVTITLIASNGACSDTAWGSLPVLRITLWAPNAFTPDESSNNIFAPVGEGIIDGELYIYNRQGLLVSHQEDYRLGWDGNYRPSHGLSHSNGTVFECPQATYVWLLIYRTVDNPSQRHTAKGTVTLLR